MIMTGQRGWRVIRGGLGAGASIGATTRTGTGTSTATQTTLPARGAQYQTVVPQRTGTGMRTALPAGRLPSAGTTAATAAQGSTPAVQLYTQPGAGGSTATVPCPVGTTYDPTTGACISTTTTTTTTYWPWIVGGAVVVVIILIAARRR